MRFTSGVGELLEVSTEDVVGKHLAGRVGLDGEAGIQECGGRAERICWLRPTPPAHAKGLRGQDPWASASDLEPHQVQGQENEDRAGGLDRGGRAWPMAEVWEWELEMGAAPLEGTWMQTPQAPDSLCWLWTWASRVSTVWWNQSASPSWVVGDLAGSDGVGTLQACVQERFVPTGAGGHTCELG